jgi:PAS domain S-box-containing protein
MTAALSPELARTLPAGFSPAQPELLQQVYAGAAVLDTIKDGLLVVDSAQRALFCNATAKALLGPAVESISGGDWNQHFEFMLPESAAATAEDSNPFLDALAGRPVMRQYVEVRGSEINNVWLSVTARPVLDDAGDVSWVYMTLRDINLDKWSEEQLRLHDRVMAAASDGIVIIDARRERYPVIFVNQGFERLTGFQASEMVGRPVTVLFRDNSRADRHEMAGKLLGDEATTVQLHSPRKDGTRFWNRMSVTPVRDRTDVITHYIAVVSDISAQIETEQQLRETSDKLRDANEQMQRNLRAAAKVQRALLPMDLPEHDGLAFAWAFEASEELSGDILNIIPLDEEHVGIYLLDVAGHGVASAMLSVTVSRLLRPIKSTASIVYEHEQGTSHYEVASPGKVATRLGMRFQWDREAGQFFTMVYGVLNCKTREFKYTCAGHPPPLRVTGEGLQPLKETPFLPIGIGQGDYEEMTVQLTPGTRLYCFSDGLFEAMNPTKELFGQERLQEAVLNARELPLEESVTAVMHRVDSWREGGPVADDTSMVAIEVQ